MSAAVSLLNVTKTFGEVTAVAGVSLDIADGEFFSMLGPSGSGKTTSLRLIAGFDTPTSGSVLLHGVDVSDVPPYDRDVNTVFQDYALFPHMTVAENVAYGLMVQRVPESERRKRVTDALEMVHLGSLGERKPAQLSGGQRQRVALARALINRPSVLLLDEPLGALDLKLRQAMQTELKTLQREVGITFIYVTHDQEEALTMSDRLAVFNNGQIEQVGTPVEVYENPRNAFVAGFVGTSNVVSGGLARRLTQSPTAFTVRPEKIAMSLGTEPGDGVHVEGTVAEIVYLGMYTRYRVAVDDDTTLEVASQNTSTNGRHMGYSVGDRVSLSWSKASCRPLAEFAGAGTDERAPAGADAGDQPFEEEMQR